MQDKTMFGIKVIDGDITHELVELLLVANVPILIEVPCQLRVGSSIPVNSLRRGRPPSTISTKNTSKGFLRRAWWSKTPLLLD